MKLDARVVDTAKPKEKAYKLADVGDLYLLVNPKTVAVIRAHIEQCYEYRSYETIW